MKEAPALAIGFISGLRSLSGIAAVSVAAAHDDSLDLSESPLAFLSSATARNTLASLAAGEYIADKLAFVPRRTTPGPLMARLGLGAVSGAALEISHRRPAWRGAVAGFIGAMCGSFAGYGFRATIAEAGAPDFPFALIEDSVAIAGLYFLLRAHHAAAQNKSLFETPGFIHQEAQYAAID